MKKKQGKFKGVFLFLSGVLGFAILLGLCYYMYTHYQLISKDTWIENQQKLDEQEKLIKQQSAKINEQEKTIKDQTVQLDQSTATSEPVKKVEEKKIEERKAESKPVTDAKPKYTIQDAYQEMGLSGTNHTAQFKELATELMNYRSQHPQMTYMVKDALKDLGVANNTVPALSTLKQAVKLIESKG